MITASELCREEPSTLRAMLAQMKPNELRILADSWRFWGRKEQQPPEWDWTTWLFLGGRGTGKTRSGAEWVKEVALKCPGIRLALLAPTRADVRDTMLYGTSGLLSLNWRDQDRPVHIAGKRGVFWPNGSQALTFSAEQPERLRGPNFHAAWADELGAWRYLEETWDLLSLGLRLEYPGFSTPRTYISTTPRPLPLLFELRDDAKSGKGSTAITSGSTYANRANLSAKFFDKVVSMYEGTTYARQEIYGDLLEDIEGALWTRALIDANRVKANEVPPINMRVVAVDPSASEKPEANECGIILVGQGQDGDAYVEGDFTTHGMSPQLWGEKVVEIYHTKKANLVVAEGNLAGSLVVTIIKQIDSRVPVKLVQAREGKYPRAEPVQLVYEQGRVHHVGNFPKLEDQMCRFTKNFKKENPGLSPDRVDALVWGIGSVMLESMYDITMGWVGA